jgi:MYXO-CTERM domain-containing protein
VPVENARVKTGGALATAMLVMLSAGSSRATTVTFADFSKTTGLTLTSAAASVTTADGAVLRLTPAAVSMTGSAFGTQLIRVHDFSSTFSFRMSGAGGITDTNGHIGADGFTFTVQPVSASIGGSGRDLGVGGVMPAVSVEFDTFCNAETMDPSSSHVGVDINGDVQSVVTADVSPYMNDGNRWYAWVDYDGTTLSVRINQTGVRPAAAQLAYEIDLAGTIGTDTAYVGFTAATGGGFQNHDIIDWTYFDHYLAPGADGGLPTDDAASGGSGGHTSDAGQAGAGGESAGQGGAGGGAGQDAGPLIRIDPPKGCGCETTGHAGSGVGGLAALAMALAGARRRRSGRR